MRPLAIQALVYGLGTAAGSLANLVLLPLYGHLFSPAEFGRLETVTAAQQVLLILCAVGMGSSLFSMYCDEDDPGRRRALAGTALCLVAWSALVAASVAVVAAPWLGAVVLRGADPGLIRLAAVQAAGGAIVLVPLAELRARGSAVGFVALSVGHVVATAGLAAWAVAGLHAGVAGAVAAGAVVSGTLGAATLAFYGLTGRVRFTRAHVKPLLGLGACHVPSSIAAWITQLADRYLLLWAAGPAQVGLYGMGYKLGSLPAAAVSGPLGLAWPAHLSRLARNHDAAPPGSDTRHGARSADPIAEACGSALEYAVAAAMAISLGAYLFVDQILGLVAKDAYTGAAPVVAWVLLGNVCNAAYPVLLSGINLSGRFGFYPLLTGTGAVTNLALNAVLIPRFGAVGAAAATTAAYACQTALAFALAQTLRPIAFPWRRIGGLAALGATAVLLGRGTAILGPATENATKAALLAAFAGSGFLLLGVRRSARRTESEDWRPAPGGP